MKIEAGRAITEALQERAAIDRRWLNWLRIRGERKVGALHLPEEYFLPDRWQE